MLKRIIFCLSAIFCSIGIQAQINAVLKGMVKDATTGESIIGASVSYAPAKGGTTDVEGNYNMTLPPGDYSISISYVGYTTLTENITVKPGVNIKNFELEVKTLKEVEITVDRAKERETPVAYSTITAEQIKEEMGPRDIPMLLTSTPGVYATQTGGGRGDSRINIRGFDQTNIPIMVDGIPMNDMESGKMYWSDFDGLGDATRSIQIQRGLGASKLAIPSMGGTINIITKGIEGKQGGAIRQEIGSNGYEKTYLSYNSGLLKDRFGFTVGASHITGNSYIDASDYTTWSYYFKFQYKLGRHILSIDGNGAPQKHEQRYASAPIAVWDKNFAKKLGVTEKQADSALAPPLSDPRTHQLISNGTGYGRPLSDGMYDSRSLRYNMHWGYLTRNGKTTQFNEENNYYNKPLINLADNWKISDKISLSNILYYSFGKGGGTYFVNAPGRINETGQYDVQSLYDYQNSAKSVNTQYDPILRQSKTILQSANSDHRWLGFLSNMRWEMSPKFSFTGGLDAREYVGHHYETVYDLVGGDYYYDASNLNIPKTSLNRATNTFKNASYVMKKQGDTMTYYNDGLIRWVGLFAQEEYKTGKFSLFLTTSVQRTAYNRIDYFTQKDLIINGKTFKKAVGWGDTMLYDGNNTITYNQYQQAYIRHRGDTTFYGKNYVVNPKKYTINSPEAHYNTSNWIYFTSYTIKGGANYNINSHYNIFFNTGYISLPPKYQNVLDNSGHIFTDAKNQVAKSAELGFGGRYTRFAFNLNAYYTIRENIPYLIQQTVNNVLLTTSVNGMNGLYKGIEFDASYALLSNLRLEGLVSIGDWIYTSSTKANVYDPGGKIVDSFIFSAKGVHVGDAAQTQVGLGFRYTVFKGLYIKPRWTYYARQWARFDPGNLVYDFGAKTDNRNRESWRMPNYSFFDLFFGYEIPYKKFRFAITGGVTNIFNTEYIADGINGGGFNAATTNVWFGALRRYQLGLGIYF